MSGEPPQRPAVQSGSRPAESWRNASTSRGWRNNSLSPPSVSGAGRVRIQPAASAANAIAAAKGQLRCAMLASGARRGREPSATRRGAPLVASALRAGQARRRAAIAVALLALAGPSAATSPPTLVIACLGDSITVGVTHRGARDPLGGYPGRLQRRVGPQVRVLNRGLAGTTTAFWLTGPSSEDGRRIWRGLLQLWPDLPRAEPPRGAKSLTRATLDVDHPDLVVVLLGVNDLGAEPAGAKIVERTSARLERIQQEASSPGRTVLLATLLPNRRDPEEPRARLNARIRARHPDALPLGERFAAAGWTHLLADEIHPSEDGYEILAAILSEELATRGYLPGAPSSTTSTSPARSAAPPSSGSGTPAAATSLATKR